MACDQHKYLANVVKTVHSNLRESCLKLGAEEAWKKHCTNTEKLILYAKCMEKLATEHWTVNENNMSRIIWTAEFCLNYFKSDKYVEYFKKEQMICSKMGLDLENEPVPLISKNLQVLDVGSCYNPFQVYEFLDVLAIDICPAKESVLKCDFLNVNIGSCLVLKDKTVHQLQNCYYDVVIFCFLLEYIPSSDLRLKACKKAYETLKAGSILIIITPDSKHVGANSQVIKCWQFSLSLIGFQRIKYEKFKHMHCMAFRKATYIETAKRWAVIHKKPYMDLCMNIPQDLCNVKEEKISCLNIESTTNDWKTLPFSDQE